jgi:hypothetical protein
MPTQLTSYAVEKSTFAVVCAFTDENSVAVVPDSVTWSLVDDAGTVINSLTDQSESPAATVTIVLSGDDLQLLDQDNASEQRYLEISAVIDTDLGSNLPLKDRAEFKVINLKSIS